MVTRSENNRSLLEVISRLFDGEHLPFDLPLGVVNVEKIDRDLLYRIADEEEYNVEAGSFASRVVDKGTIVARVGTQSDPGGENNIFIYLFPPFVEQMSTYRIKKSAGSGTRLGDW